MEEVQGRTCKTIDNLTGKVKMSTLNKIKSKGRPRKKKIVEKGPRIDSFNPQGTYNDSEVSILTMEEYEAVRLSDHVSLQQRDAAMMMGISQQSFSRLIRDARKKIADALVNAKSIRIEGGDFVNKEAE